MKPMTPTMSSIRRAIMALTLLAVACSSAPTALVPERLAGRWSWTSATGGIAGRTITPLFGGWEEMGVQLPGPDRLVLADGCCDGYTYDFERVE
jgi:hypothetical protein